ncbi:MAG: DUF4185 domain-containing protein [Micrococcales bacterium]|nr:DUF4185 domain-containing protein [Micrococcales bacterium]OJX67379.1 MAG: hypothetical protein BGO94_00620 [Micrococcales bacterium 72-143]
MTASDGDLWPSAWASDGSLYAAAGDGTGFARRGWSDILVNRIDGTPETGLTGERLSDGDAVAPIWDPERFNRKPTGMACVRLDGRDVLLLAVQDLRCTEGPDMFNEAPTATIVRSDDLGRTWTWPEQPMFTDHVFTTVMLLDLGQANGGCGWVYAYGIDGNWRTSFSKIVDDPTALYLARVPAARAQDREAWEFISGYGDDGSPLWTHDIGRKHPVLVDERRHYPEPVPGMDARGFTGIAQGGVVWNPGLGRYLYSSWSEYTFEFFEAPAPWGPWRLLHRHDFGHFPWHGPRSPIAKHGGYAPTMPSKFISPDGRDLWLQSNWFVPASSRGGRAYSFGLRRVRFDPGTDAVAPASGNLALDGAWPLVSRAREGQEAVLNDGTRDYAEDSAFGPGSGEDVWGYTWAAPRRMARLVYAPGPQDSLGGWFASPPRVEVRIDGTWRAVEHLEVAPPYPCDFTALEEDAYVFSFAPVVADGIRLTGEPGGPLRYTSISELEVWA